MEMEVLISTPFVEPSVSHLAGGGPICGPFGLLSVFGEPARVAEIVACKKGVVWDL